jgi:hypothetical protein
MAPHDASAKLSKGDGSAEKKDVDAQRKKARLLYR